MLFNSLHFLLFFPVVLVVFHLIPKRAKTAWLLVCSYYFYMAWNARYALLLLFSTVVTYICALLIDRVNHKDLEEKTKSNRKKLLVITCIILNLVVLFFFKYFNFFCSSIISVSRYIGLELSITGIDVLLPVGISFYTFQAIGYTIDVYRGDTEAERNFIRYALFVSFFPQLVAGPIERSGNLLRSLKEFRRPSFEKMRHGFLVMIWGFFLKMVIADRIAVFVDTVYSSHHVFNGLYIVVATILFAFQIYCDFAGYSTIAIGAAEMLGIELMKNFDTPYLSTSVKEFWRRWHISLSSWFRDYLYIPLGGSRRGTIRKYLNLLIVFVVSGLWHGAQWSFVVWGFLNGLYQVIGDAISSIRKKQKSPREISFAERMIRGIATFALIDFTWIFFRANGLSDAFAMIKNIFTYPNPWILFDGSLYLCGLNEKEFFVMLCSLIILFIADLYAHKGISISSAIEKQPIWFRWPVYLIGILSIIVFGVWGSGYNASSFIYFQF